MPDASYLSEELGAQPCRVNTIPASVGGGGALVSTDASAWTLQAPGLSLWTVIFWQWPPNQAEEQ